jgi:hypothetical protein
VREKQVSVSLSKRGLQSLGSKEMRDMEPLRGEVLAQHISPTAIGISDKQAGEGAQET